MSYSLSRAITTPLIRLSEFSEKMASILGALLIKEWTWLLVTVKGTATTVILRVNRDFGFDSNALLHGSPGLSRVSIPKTCSSIRTVCL